MTAMQYKTPVLQSIIHLSGYNVNVLLWKIILKMKLLTYIIKH